MRGKTEGKKERERDGGKKERKERKERKLIEERLITWQTFLTDKW